jgi:hypothetical protein
MLGFNVEQDFDSCTFEVAKTREALRARQLPESTVARPKHATDLARGRLACMNAEKTAEHADTQPDEPEGGATPSATSLCS